MKKASELEIPTYGNPTVAEMQNRIDNWLPGKGWLFRRLHQKHHPLLDGLEVGPVYFIANSKHARDIIETKSVVVLSRCVEPPEGVQEVKVVNVEEEEE